VKTDDIGFRDIADLSETCFLNSAYEDLVCFNFMLSYYKTVAYLKTHEKQNIYTDVNTAISTYMK
jgi:hypothetical protein